MGLLDIKNLLEEAVDEDLVHFEEVSTRDIAIIGMAGIFPEADDVDEFWQNLSMGKDCIRKFPVSRRKDTDRYLVWKGMKEEQIGYSEWGFLDEIDKFDPLFFKISPKEANLMDPNQRLFLQVAWNCIEEAGYGGQKLKGSKTGVYVGYNTDFSDSYKSFISEVAPSMASLSIPGNINSIIASRISYILDLHGPSMMIDTACSSVLTAIHQACTDLRNGKCDKALVGGVKLSLLPLQGNEGIGIKSSDYRAKTFDHRSDGTGFGEGVGAIMLKPLSKALEDRDHIHAVIKGGAVNQDGASVGITAPNSLAQADLIEAAWKDAEVPPESITYIEAHGTGTQLGDPIEIDGITRAFQKYTTKKQFCGVGSIKSNIGHLDHAAGIAGIFKMILALKHKQIPPTLHFAIPNREISFEESPVYVVDRLIEWSSDQYPLRCGISSFGLSGTNCHLILEEAPEGIDRANKGANSYHIFTISAKTENSLRSLLEKYRDILEEKESLNLADLCYTANTGRGHYSHRLAMIVKNEEDFREKIKKVAEFDFEQINEADIYYSAHKVVTTNKEQKHKGEISEEEQKELSRVMREKIGMLVQQYSN